MDNLFLDETGTLNKLDINNPSAGFQRSKITNVFTGSFTSTGFGTNVFSTTSDSDMAYSEAENTMYLSRLTSLATVNFESTLITGVGSFGTDGSGNAISLTGLAAINPVPEPATMVALFAGITALTRKRSNRSK
jgi:hypothetical protein